MSKYKIGNVVKGTVTGIETYGAFVSLDEYDSGLIHISEMANGFVNHIGDYLKIGDHIYTKIIGLDNKENHYKLSIKNIKYKIGCPKPKRQIRETGSGFKILKDSLPGWIKEKKH